MYFMNIPKPIKVILILVGGLISLWLLSILASAFIYNEKNKVNTGTVDYGVAGEDSGKGVKPSIAPAPDEKDLMYYPGYETGGDGSMLIKNASIAITVNDIDNTIASIKSHVEGVKGFVQSLSDSGTENERASSITIRVPSSEFDKTMTKLKELSVEVVSSSEGSDDVSGTYKDVETRLKTQKALEKQLLQLLDKATKIEDILTLQRELANVRSVIESYELQLKNYDQQVDMSTIYIKVSKASEALDITGEAWKPFGVFKEALTSLVDFSKGIVNVTIWALVFSPVILIPAGIVWLVTRKRKV